MDINNILNYIDSDINISAKDYVGADGLIHCGNCDMPKEMLVNIKLRNDIIPRKVKCLCKCEEEQLSKENIAREKREAQLRIERLRSASLIENKLLNASFKDCTSNKYNKKNIELCKKYSDLFNAMVEKNQGLLFWGDVGTGKSYAAACIANYLLDKEIPVLMTSFVKILELIKEWGEEEKMSDSIKSVKLAVFDDLGAERNTDYAIEKIYNIIDSRYRTGLPMIVTTNIPLDQMINETDIRYKRIYDRILDVCYPVKWDGPSWRKIHANKRFAEMEKILGGEA